MDLSSLKRLRPALSLRAASTIEQPVRTGTTDRHDSESGPVPYARGQRKSAKKCDVCDVRIGEGEPVFYVGDDLASATHVRHATCSMEYGPTNTNVMHHATPAKADGRVVRKRPDDE